jgi:hypothetical protein
MPGWPDHTTEVFGSRLSRLLLTAVGRNHKTICIQFDEKGPRIEHSMFTTAIHFPKRPYFVLATGLSWNVPVSERIMHISRGHNQTVFSQNPNILG